MGSVHPLHRCDHVTEVALSANAVTARQPPGELGDGGERVVFERIQRPRGSAAAASRAARVLIADAKTLVRAGLRALLERGQRIKVVGEAATGEEAVALARRLRPDVVLIDARLPGLDSLDATAQMSAESRAVAVLLTSSESDERIFTALRAGASGLLLTDTDPVEFVLEVEALARGETRLSPNLTRRLIAELASRPEPSYPSSDRLVELTAREREVVALVALGLSNDGIGQRLVVSPATAKTHVSRAMIKLHARDRAQLVVFAYQAGLVVPHRNSLARGPTADARATRIGSATPPIARRQPLLAQS
jgi:DNA-binding NarL/FixJ family response regulator